MKKLESLAIVGATGLVGQTFLDLLNEGFFPGVNIYLVASKKSKGKEIQVRGKNHIVSSLEEFDFSSIDLAFFSAGATTAEIYAPKAVKQGCVVIDNSSFFRYKEDVPLIVIAEIGRTEINVQNVLNLKKGNLVVFDKIVGEPMDIVVGDRLMARGEIVVVNERYGVRISEVTRPEEKIGERRE